MYNRTLRRRSFSRSLLSCALASCLALAAPTALAQATGATLRGQVSADSAPAAGARVTATNVNTGLTRSVQSSAGGRYNLAGLPPGTYRVEVAADGQTTTETVTLQVGQTATLDLGVGGVAETGPQQATTDLDTITVTGTMLAETRTSEIATYVSQKQIEALPQGTRNFLAFADTVPGVQFVQDNNGNTRLRSGSQAASAVNVFIDGVGQKSYTLPGGVAGQDSTRGNPFPQSAIGEYKVITQNYKAEFDQISSAAVVAATRSGTNEFEGSFFWDRTSSDWRQMTPAEEEAGEKVDSKEEQYGASLAGPLIRDRLHFFVAYEAKDYVTPRTVELGNESRYDIADVPAELQAQLGPTNSPFAQDMFFGKLSWSINDYNFLEFTGQLREEDEIIGVGGQNAPSRATVNANEVTRYDLRWQFSNEDWLNDAHLTFEDTSWAPQAVADQPGYALRVSELSPTDRENIAEVLNAGGSPNSQDKGQEGWGFQNDLTFFGWEGHTLKMGVKYKDVEVNAIERHFSNPMFYYDIGTSTEQPYRVEFGTGIPGTSEGFTTSSNKQFGIYIQDDWEVNEHLILNLGVRWDYEETPTYEDYVTPANVAAALRAWPNLQGPNVDYDIEDYISDGSNRDAFDGAWQPRVGFSYDVNADQRFVVFGGAGRAYDRNLFDYLQIEVNRASFARYNAYFVDADGQCRNEGGCLDWDEAYYDPDALQQLAQGLTTGREWYLNNNDLKVPYSDQLSLGVRNVFGMFGQEWNSEVALSHVRSKDGIVFRLGNRREDGSFYEDPGDTSGPPWGFPSPVGTVLLVDNMGETRTNSLLAKLDKPFTPDSGWGATFAYTYTDGEQNIAAEGWPEIFSQRDTGMIGWLPARGVAEHRFVGTGIWDGPWGVTWSAKLTLESMRPRVGENCLAGWDMCRWDSYKPDGTLGFKQFDVAATKTWNTGTDISFYVRADLLNAFNWRNWNSYDDWWGSIDGPNENFGDRNLDIQLPTRSFKLSFGVNW
ncbi:TonB-dependent receptor [Luteimonas sp. RD2P54]|uniref:TonB-dependent receptor n=1 Tax=Luteimonas endophytica TaxID=3042023 RepID=A0ABT6J4V5_9GAMM|nr:TonB-dependent receptor [Luteimonas endophytica]MDH5821645.1 TonB-dependent receptor [Luteimonas endophytica]